MKRYRLDSAQAFLVSLLALIEHNSKILMLQSAPQHRFWELPGGILDFDETMEEGLRREVREETNLEVQIGRLVVAGDRPTTPFTYADGRTGVVRLVKLVYWCKKISGEVRLSDEHDEFRWGTPAQLLRLPRLHPIAELALREYAALPKRSNKST